MLSAAAQAEQLKAKGNEYFKREKIGAAIDAYTEAIVLCPTVPAYWTNRAVCFKRKGEWEKAQNDCRKALELDKSSFKAHRLLGTALLQLKHYPDAIRYLKKAVDLGASSGLPPENVHMVEVERDLMRAKYEEWQVDASARRERQRRLKERLTGLLAEDHNRRIDALGAQQDKSPAAPSKGSRWNLRFSAASSAAAPVEVEGAARSACTSGCTACTNESCTGELCCLKEEHMEMINTLENVFDAAEQPDIVREVPEYLCCSITMDVFRDPVVTPSGVTYERSIILEHLARGRNFDPVSRAPLDASQLIPNLALKDAVRDYVDRHGWAHQNVFQPS